MTVRSSDHERVFWQGGKKIPINPSANQITIQAPSEEVVSDLASDAGVRLRNLETVAEGVVAAEVTDRDSSMKKLRESAVVHHVYHRARRTRRGIPYR